MKTLLKKKKKDRTARSLVVNRLENVSKEAFRKYYGLITELVGNSPGVYALYDGSELYYVGKSTDLKKRVKHHLRDKHFASWTHFSLFLVRNVQHIHEIESLLVRIANPKGNKIVPKGKMKSEMLKKLKAMIIQKQKEELLKMFGETPGSKTRKKIRLTHPKTLEGLVDKITSLHKEYKGRKYKAKLTPKGQIKIGNKTYNTPTAAAKSIVKHGVNGWKFWYIEDLNGEWVRLLDYQG